MSEYLIETREQYKKRRKQTSAQRWNAAKRLWFKNNPPNHEGYYQCWIGNEWVSAKETTLDHVIPRSRRPDLIDDQTNLKPACWEHNSEKGSKVYEE